MAYKAEDIDIDQFFNLEGAFASPALANLNKGKGVIAPQFQQPIEKVNTYAPFQTSQTLSGPSHQYELYKQHIPLPPGAITSSLASARPLQYNGYPNYGMGSNTGLFDMNEEFVDFSMHRGSTDMDMDFDSPLDTYNGDYMDPNAMGGHEEDSPVPAKAEIPMRAYPGMHSAQAQQAALAKQQQQQQMEIQRQQQLRQKSQSSSSVWKGANKAPADPVVEERISRLLSQMRQTVNVPVRHMDENSPPSMMKSRKDEEDMDEDERLLASEEGKKLSSKERRQLRNKVSARAFRSRRKEYIGQLEGEVAQKTGEADSLRSENEALKAENVRLTDLTKLLLSSSAFSTFLNDLSTNGLPASIKAPVAAPTPAHSVTPPPEQRQYTPQPPVTTIVEEDLDFNGLDVNSNWSSGMDMTFAPQVFAVTELPEGPIIDATFLSGKNSTKETFPVIEAGPVAEKVEPQYTPDESIELDETQFSIFADRPAQAAKEPSLEFFGSISFEKATETFNLIVDDEEPCCDGEVSVATMVRFESLNSSLEILSSRLENLICN